MMLVNGHHDVNAIPAAVQAGWSSGTCRQPGPDRSALGPNAAR
jgi:hypothetical protein